MTTTISRRSLLLGLATVAGAPALAVATAGGAQAAAPVTALVRGDVNLRKGPSTRQAVLLVLRRGTRVQLAGPVRAGWRPVVAAGRLGYVSEKWLAIEPAGRPVKATTGKQVTSAPAAPAVTGYAALPAAARYSAPSGVTARARAVAAEVHALFPQVATIGGYRAEAGSDHNSGRAIDVMLPGDHRGAAQQALGRAMAEFARSNATRLGISYVIWDQHIWSVARQKEGWRLMPNRGSDNANHRNHVHISVN